MKYSIVTSLALGVAATALVPLPLTIATGLIGVIAFTCSILILEFCC